MTRNNFLKSILALAAVAVVKSLGLLAGKPKKKATWAKCNEINLSKGEEPPKYVMGVDPYQVDDSENKGTFAFRYKTYYWDGESSTWQPRYEYIYLSTTEYKSQTQ